MRSTQKKFHAYYTIRDLLSPKAPTARFIILLSIVFNSFLGLAIRVITDNLVFVFQPLLTTPIILSSIYYYKYSKKERNNPVKILHFSDDIKLITISIVTVLLANTIFVSSTYTVTTLKILVSVAPLLYLVLVWWSYGLHYNEEYTNFVFQNSEDKLLWITASISMDKAEEHRRKANFYRSYYYYKTAETLYETLSSTETRPIITEIAESYRTALEYLAKSIAHPNGSDKTRLFEKGNKFLQQAVDLTQYRVCDMCNQRRTVSNIFYNRENDSYVCSTCHKTQTTSSSNQTRNATNKTNSTRSNSSKTSSTTSDTSSTNSTTNVSSIEKACNYLDIEQPLTEREIENAFKEKVKQTHPDKGGSPEEFKQTKQARKTLLNHVENNK